MHREVDPFGTPVRGFMTVAGALIGSTIIILICIWIGQGSSFFLYRYFAPKEEAVRRQTFEQSKAYNQGMIQELQNMEFEYEQADDAHKDVLGAIILHRAADYDVDKLPPDLGAFISQLRTAHTKGHTP